MDTFVRYALKSSLELRHPLRDSLDWLSDVELNELSRWRDAGRRQAWLDGRWLGKTLCCQFDGATIDHGSLRRWTISSLDSAGRGRQPRLLRDNIEVPQSVSISHADGMVIVGLIPAPSWSLGVDIVANQPLAKGLPEFWFSTEERRAVERNEMQPHSIWAAKEAVYKACNQGRSFAPRGVEIRQGDDGSLFAIYDGQILAERCRIDSWQEQGCFLAMATFEQSVAVS